MKSFRFILLFLFFIPLAVMPQRVGDGNEYDLKALFIFNFIKYIDWSQVNDPGSFKIVVLGPSEIKESLQKIAAQKKVNNQNVEVSASEDIDEINCRVLFIPGAMSDRLSECISRFAGKGTLIVTEGKNLASKGSAINFVTLDNKMKFEINQTAVRNAGLKVSGQLLDLAIVVK